MKLGAIVCIYNEADIIESCIKGAYSYVDKMVLLVAVNPLYGRKGERGDQSLKIVKKINDPKNRLEIVSGSWKVQWQQREEGLRRLKKFEMTHCLILDADEFYTEQGWGTIRKLCEMDEADIFRVRITHFWRSFHYRIVAKGKDFLATLYKIDISLHFINRLSRGPLYGNRRKTMRKRIKNTDIMMYHLSYARPMGKLRQKFRTNGALRRKMGAGADQFLNKVGRWQKERKMGNLHPLVPGMWKFAKRHSLRDLPKVLREHKYARMDIIK